MLALYRPPLSRGGRKMAGMTAQPSRVLALQGASNFRDLGGYIGSGGRPVRWRRLFRSAHLGALTEADKAVIAGLGVAKSFDFRGQAERAAAAYQLPGVQQHALTIEPTVVQRLQDLASPGRRISAAMTAALMIELYRGLINDQSHRFAELFAMLLEADAPVVMHCTAGKDRTGIAAALLLLALGVQREVVAQDFLLSNEALRHAPLEHDMLSPEAMTVLWRVQPGFLEAALHEVDTGHGGIERYLTRRLGLSAAARATLAARWLA
jgi:protein-tyrosine phosphatase